MVCLRQEASQVPSNQKQHIDGIQVRWDSPVCAELLAKAVFVIAV